VRVHIDYNSSEPIYRQAVEQIKLMVVSRQLREGDHIPSIRELARELAINPTTAAKIYTELEHAGVLTLRQGQGAFIRNNPSLVAPKAARKIVADLAQRMIVEGLRLGLDSGTIQGIVGDELGRIAKGRS
jgi:GntR family transcriptional regulator